MPPVRMPTYFSRVEDESGSRASPAVLCCAGVLLFYTKLRHTHCACTSFMLFSLKLHTGHHDTLPGMQQHGR